MGCEEDKGKNRKEEEEMKKETIIGLIVFCFIILIVTGIAIIAIAGVKEDFLVLNKTCNKECGENNWDMDGQINSSTYVFNLSAPCKCEINGVEG